MLELSAVSKRLGAFALDQLNLQVQPGEYFVLLGPSGVGKTVLVELIAGLMQPDAGAIRWQQQEVTTTAPEKRGFAVVYQDQALFPHMTVADNIAYGLRARGQSRREITARVGEMAGYLGIMPLLNRHPDTLSGGERQRAALARALIVEPSLVLLDEPLSALDVKARRQLRQELQRIHRESGRTFLHITHDIDEAMSLGNRVGVMLNGKIHQVGTPEEILRTPSDSEVADFLGMHNVFAAAKIEDGSYTIGNGLIRIDAGKGPISYLWIKPEEILLSSAPITSSARYQFRGTVHSWDYVGAHLAVRLMIEELPVYALVTYTSFQALQISMGTELYVTIGECAIYCF